MEQETPVTETITETITIMEWPTPETINKSWGSNGFDRHYIQETKK